MRARRHVAIALCPLALLVACGDDDSDAGTDLDTTAVPSGAAATNPETDTLTKPSIAPKSEPAPADLTINDLVVGTGAEATAGAVVDVHYVGVHYATGEQFDASWDRGDPLIFTLGVGQVIQGWDLGVVGMRVGGRRELIIPPQLAYGDSGAGGVIQPGETLVFVVDLVRVSS